MATTDGVAKAAGTNMRHRQAHRWVSLLRAVMSATAVPVPSASVWRNSMLHELSHGRVPMDNPLFNQMLGNTAICETGTTPQEEQKKSRKLTPTAGRSPAGRSATKESAGRLGDECLADFLASMPRCPTRIQQGEAVAWKRDLMGLPSRLEQSFPTYGELGALQGLAGVDTELAKWYIDQLGLPQEEAWLCARTLAGVRIPLPPRGSASFRRLQRSALELLNGKVSLWSHAFWHWRFTTLLEFSFEVRKVLSDFGYNADDYRAAWRNMAPDHATVVAQELSQEERAVLINALREISAFGAWPANKAQQRWGDRGEQEFRHEYNEIVRGNKDKLSAEELENVCANLFRWIQSARKAYGDLLLGKWLSRNELVVQRWAERDENYIAQMLRANGVWQGSRQLARELSLFRYRRPKGAPPNVLSRGPADGAEDCLSVSDSLQLRKSAALLVNNYKGELLRMEENFAVKRYYGAHPMRIPNTLEHIFAPAPPTNLAETDGSSKYHPDAICESRKWKQKYTELLKHAIRAICDRGYPTIGNIAVRTFSRQPFGVDVDIKRLGLNLDTTNLTSVARTVATWPFGAWDLKLLSTWERDDFDVAFVHHALQEGVADAVVDDEHPFVRRYTELGIPLSRVETDLADLGVQPPYAAVLDFVQARQQRWTRSLAAIAHSRVADLTPKEQQQLTSVLDSVCETIEDCRRTAAQPPFLSVESTEPRSVTNAAMARWVGTDLRFVEADFAALGRSHLKRYAIHFAGIQPALTRQTNAALRASVLEMLVDNQRGFPVSETSANGSRCFAYERLFNEPFPMVYRDLAMLCGVSANDEYRKGGVEKSAQLLAARAIPPLDPGRVALVAGDLLSLRGVAPCTDVTTNAAVKRYAQTDFTAALADVHATLKLSLGTPAVKRLLRVITRIPIYPPGRCIQWPALDEDEGEGAEGVEENEADSGGISRGDSSDAALSKGNNNKENSEGVAIRERGSLANPTGRPPASHSRLTTQSDADRARRSSALGMSAATPKAPLGRTTPPVAREAGALGAAGCADLVAAVANNAPPTKEECRGTEAEGVKNLFALYALFANAGAPQYAGSLGEEENLLLQWDDEFEPQQQHQHGGRRRRHKRGKKRKKSDYQPMVHCRRKKRKQRKKRRPPSASTAITTA